MPYVEVISNNSSEEIPNVGQLQKSRTSNLLQSYNNQESVVLAKG